MLNDKKLTSFLFVFEGVGAVFVAVFLSAYLGGLFYTPQTTVLHSEPAFRIPLTIFGAAYLVLVLASIIIAIYVRKKR